VVARAVGRWEGAPAAVAVRVWQPVRMSGPWKPSAARRRGVRSWRALGLLCGALLLSGCTAGEGRDSPTSIRVAVDSSDPEVTLLGATLLELLEDTGRSVRLIPFADDRSARQALELGDADIGLAYTGQAWLELLGRADPPADPAAALRELRTADAERGLVWFEPVVGEGIEQPPANATFAFFVAGPPSSDADLRTLSQLSLRLSERPEASLCVDVDFGRRTDGLAAMLSTYSVRRDRPFLAADPEAAILGVLTGSCLAGLSHATDGRAWSAGLRLLVDDLRFFPAFVPLPVADARLLARDPGVEQALRPMLARLSTGLLGRANARVVAGEPIDLVARDLATQLQQAMQDQSQDRPGDRPAA
jgi:glycine betaine/choline ABC-type transport system substrate-binding protein